MSKKPRQKISEMVLDSALTGEKFLIVEGYSDVRFFKYWITACKPEKIPVILPVDAIHVSDSAVADRGLNLGNRSRILAAADECNGRSQGILFVADRDMGQDLDDFIHLDCLCVTDFPAIESFGLDRNVLDRFNFVALNEKLPAASDYFDDLCRALRGLYAYRLSNPHRAAPNYKKGANTGSKQMDSFSPRLAFGEIKEAEQLQDTDPRSYAYGHDILGVLYAVNAYMFRKDLGFGKIDALEAIFRLVIVDAGAMRGTAMEEVVRNFLIEA